MLLTGARLPDGRRADVLVRDGRVVATAPALAPGPDEPILDLPGYLLLPAPAEPHAHLDKALSWDAVGCGEGDLLAAIRSWRRWSERMTVEDVRERALRALRIGSAHGVTALRTHVDLGRPEIVEAVLDVRDEVRDVLDVQVTALTSPTTPDAEVRAAVSMGVDLVGGCPHLADDPAAETRRLLDIAERAGVPVDLHTDERLDPSVCSLRDLAAMVVERAFPGAVTASHCVSLGVLDPPLLAEVIDGLLRARIGVVTLPQTNLYLQGRDRPHSTPRGLTAVRALLGAGVPLAAGGDNLRDPFNPMGRGDPMEVASLLVTAGHLDVATAYEAVSGAVRRVLGLPPAGPEPGMVADLLAIRAQSLAEAVGGATQDRVVIRRGHVVGRTTVTHHGFPAGGPRLTPGRDEAGVPHERAPDERAPDERAPDARSTRKDTLEDTLKEASAWR